MSRAVFFALFAIAGCGASMPSPADELRVDAYGAEQLACVAEAGTRAEADACRCAARAPYDRPCDGGAP